MKWQVDTQRWFGSLVLTVAALAALAIPLQAQGQPTGLPSIGTASGADLSPAWEQRLGDSIIAQGRRDPTFVHDAELNQYLNDMGNRLAQYASGSAPRIELFGVKDPAFNAFALPGGYIGINTGLIVQADSEAEVAGVMAHEIAHVTQRHIARGLTQSQQSERLAMATVAASLLAALAGGVDMAAGVAAFGQAAVIDQQLGFSRSAEREADRIGFQMLSQSGYDPQGLEDMFGKLMRSAQMNVNASGNNYLSTHPLSIDRMTDMQNRTQTAPKRQYQDSPAFWYIRSKSLILQTDSRRALSRIVEQLQDEGRRFEGVKRSAAWWALAELATQSKQYADARRFLGYANKGVSANPFLARQSVAILLAEGNAQKALAAADQALARWPQHRALAELKAKSLQALARHAEAARFLETQTRKWPAEAPGLYEMMAQNLLAADQPVQARVAMADYYVLTGAYPAAMAQLQQAREMSDDFHAKSKLDVRIRALRERMAQEQEVLERFSG